jgi:hypothetical protein
MAMAAKQSRRVIVIDHESIFPWRFAELRHAMIDIGTGVAQQILSEVRDPLVEPTLLFTANELASPVE